MITITPYSSVGNTQNQAFSAYLAMYYPASDYLMYRGSMYTTYCYIWHDGIADALLVYNSDTSSFTVSNFEYSGFNVSNTSMVYSSVSDYGYPSYSCTQLIVSRETTLTAKDIRTSSYLLSSLVLFALLFLAFQNIFRSVCKYDKN